MKTLKLCLFLFTAAILNISCKKDLDQQPKDFFSDANAFQSYEDVQNGANSAYQRYGGSAGDFGAYINDMYVNALLSDEAKIGANNTGFGGPTYRYQFNTDDVTGADVTAAWGGYYRVIDQVNRVLPQIYTVPVAPSGVSRLPILEAQLKALRAISHFGLLESYSKIYTPGDPLGVPIVLQSNPVAKPARNSVDEVLAQIDADLTAAKDALPVINGPGDFSDTVMNRVNIAAYQARIALYKRDYNAAIAFSSEVINSGVKPLTSGSDFRNIWTDDDDGEVLFRIRYIAGNSLSTAVGTLWSTVSGQVSIAPSDKLAASYSIEDIRRDTYIGTNSTGARYVNKFYTSGGGGRVVDIKACRIAEMYLIRAEAYAKQGSPNLTNAAADLNFLRSNRITGYVDETFTSAQNLINAVLDERFKELCFEGFRFFDLKRNGLPVNRLPSDANSEWQTLEASNFRFVLPIPRYEILTNSNIAQNPGY